MKTIKIDKNSKTIKFLTADSDHQPLFGIFRWRPEPYGRHLGKPLPEDTCSLRKALISHTLGAISMLLIWTMVFSIIAMAVLSALIAAPYEIYAGILMKGTMVGALGFTT